MERFEFDGEKYKQASRHQKEWGNSLIASLTLKGDEHILDLGCGDGALTEQLAELVPEGMVLGVDASQGMIDTAITRQAANLRFCGLDIRELEFVGQFDVIFSNAALHWIHDHEKLLADCHRALKPGGRLAWNFAAEGTCTNFNEIVLAVIKQPEYREYFTRFQWPWYMPKAEAYSELMERAGFSHYEVQAENKDRYFDDAQEMGKWLDQPSLVPFLTVLPAAKKAGFRDQVFTEMRRQTERTDGRCFETFRRIHVTATK